jgi:5S rRNA maturation endonuclease (ribonuclease M5)
MITNHLSRTGTSYSNADIQLLKESVDLSTLVFSLGFNITHENSREIRAACIIHGGDNKSAFRLNKETRTWQCFTNKCQNECGYDLIGLIKGVLKIDFLEAVNYLKDLVGDSVLSGALKTERYFAKDKDSFIKSYSTPKKPDYVSEDHLTSYRPLRSNVFISKDGFTNNTLNYFEVSGGLTDDFGILRDIIPIRDVDGVLKAYSLRDTRLNPPDDSYKYIITSGFLKDTVLYNLHNAKLYGNIAPIIVVEGFKSVWRLYDYGIYNVVCTMGSFISPGQVNLLKIYALKGVIIMFDADKAGKSGSILGEEDLKKAGVASISIDISKSVTRESDSPAELSSKILYGYLNDYIR